MSFSVGILYSTQSFIEFVKENEVNGTQFPIMFKKFKVADAKSVLDTALKCNWVTLNVENQLEVTKLGHKILMANDSRSKLRIQISNLIEINKPNWSPLICYGRSEAMRFFPEEVKQCFGEAGLLSNYDKDTVEWWDNLSSIVRGVSEDINLLIGRYGERLSIIYEEQRIGMAPKWQAIESNLSGYDILSKASTWDKSALRIEVKVSSSGKSVKFHITKNEWNVATNIGNYIFHIWKIKPEKQLYIFSVEDMKDHIPINQGKGVWESVLVEIEEAEIEEFKVKTNLESLKSFNGGSQYIIL